MHLNTATNFPLTPALSPSTGEREPRTPAFRNTCRLSLADALAIILPLPRRGGEGRGEGQRVILVTLRLANE